MKTVLIILVVLFIIAYLKKNKLWESTDYQNILYIRLGTMLHKELKVINITKKLKGNNNRIKNIIKWEAHNYTMKQVKVMI